LADHRGLAVLAEEILWRCPERADEFKAQVSKADKAMWMFLHVPEAFDEAAMFARADALAAGRYWNRRNGLPRKQIVVDQAVRERLAEALTSFYGPTQMRGRHCHVVHYPRSGGSNYFFAYLDDYPDKRLVFDGDGDEPTVRADRYAFENVFVYNGDDGSMERFAQGGKKVSEPLQAAFCQAVLGEDIDPADPLRPSFQLDHLLTPEYPLPTDPQDGVEEAGSHGCAWRRTAAAATSRSRPIPRPTPTTSTARWNVAQASVITAAGTRVLQATFHLKFLHDGPGRQPTLTFDVLVPNSCNLKSKPDEQREVASAVFETVGDCC
jgi:hypothetical protein